MPCRGCVAQCLGMPPRRYTDDEGDAVAVEGGARKSSAVRLNLRAVLRQQAERAERDKRFGSDVHDDDTSATRSPLERIARCTTSFLAMTPPLFDAYRADGVTVAPILVQQRSQHVLARRADSAPTPVPQPAPPPPKKEKKGKRERSEDTPPPPAPPQPTLHDRLSGAAGDVASNQRPTSVSVGPRACSVCLAVALYRCTRCRDQQLGYVCSQACLEAHDATRCRKHVQ